MANTRHTTKAQLEQQVSNAKFRADYTSDMLKKRDKKILIVNELASLGAKTIQIEVAHILFQNIKDTIN